MQHHVHVTMKDRMFAGDTDPPADMKKNFGHLLNLPGSQAHRQMNHWLSTRIMYFFPVTGLKKPLSFPPQFSLLLQDEYWNLLSSKLFGSEFCLVLTTHVRSQRVLLCLILSGTQIWASKPPGSRQAQSPTAVRAPTAQICHRSPVNWESQNGLDRKEL